MSARQKLDGLMVSWQACAIEALRARGIPADVPADCRRVAGGRAAFVEVRVPSSQIERAADPKVAQGITAEISGARACATPVFARLAAEQLGHDWSVQVARAGALLRVTVPLVRSLRAALPLADMKAEGLRVEIGETIDGSRAVLDLRNSHALIAGVTRGGKTSLVRTVLAGLARHNDPADLHLVVADVKNRLLAGPLARLQHLVLAPATSRAEREALLQLLVREQERRAGMSVEDVARQPYVLLVADEAHRLGDQMDTMLQLAREGGEFKLRLLLITQMLRKQELDPGIRDQCQERICVSVAPGDWRTARAVVGSTEPLQLSGYGDVYGIQQGRFQAAYARLADPDGRPDDPFWSDAAWVACTTRRPLPALTVGEEPDTAGEARPAPPSETLADQPHPSQVPREMEGWQRTWIKSEARRGADGKWIMPGKNRTRRTLRAGYNAVTRWLDEVLRELIESDERTQGTQASHGSQGAVIDLEERRRARGA